MHVTIDDILHFLVADTTTPSTMGAQLERLKFGLISTPDPHRAREDAESHILEQAELLRCIDDFKRVNEFRPPTAKASGYRTLEKLQKASNPKLPQGQIALDVLRSYQRWGTQSQERGFVAVYGYMKAIAPRIPPPIASTDAVAATQEFREGKAKRARLMAGTAMADALLALGSFLTKRNKQRRS